MRLVSDAVSAGQMSKEQTLLPGDVNILSMTLRRPGEERVMPRA
jgi:hypothetical protein